MRRRDYLAAAAAVGAVGVAGCGGGVETRALRSTPPALKNRPEGVYHPTHVDGMEPVGTTETGDYAVALTYTYPHRFWRVDAATESVADAARESPDGTDVHLMALAWDPETGRTLPESGLSLEIARDGATVEEGVVYNMLSPQMGFHYGANFALDGDGTYDVRVTVGGTTVRRTGAYRGRFGDPATVTVPFEYAADARDEIPVERTPDRAGERTAPDRMEMSVPLGVAPEPAALPGEHRGTAASGDAELVVVTTETPPAGVDGEGSYSYLAVSARTPYNRLLLPRMTLAATLRRDGTTVFDGELVRTFDDRLDYHYGAVVGSPSAGDELTVRVRTAPQVDRHEGYETAFLSMPDASLTLSF
ncbi:hypothetical protein BRC88_04940 [Halobacteriales archaeon QS_4_69_225]|nr:MAG: hypothetical protein BRC88_04940 [Halobacteriales archaeon QS_4_69_225]